MIRKISIAVLLIIPLLAACAAKGPAGVARVEVGKKTQRAVALQIALDKITEATKTMKAMARVRISDGYEERDTDAVLALERPDRIRIDAMDALADVWALAGSDGRRVWLSIPAKGKLYTGRASKSNLQRLTNFEWELNELISVIAGSPPFMGDFNIVQVGASGENHFMFEGSDLHIWTGSNSLPSRCARIKSGSDKPDYEINFGNYKKIGDVMFPMSIDAAFPEKGAKIAVVYKDLMLGGEINQSVFAVPAGGAGKTVELKDKK